MILVDAGPLVALIHADDNHHQRCTEAFRDLDESMNEELSRSSRWISKTRRECAS